MELDHVNQSSSMESISAALSHVYAEVCRAPADHRVISAWAKAIKTGSKIIKDFVDYLINRPEYRVAVENRYKQLLEEMVSSAAFDASEFDRIFSMHAGSIVRDADLSRYIRTLPSFREKHKQLVLRVIDIMDAQSQLTDEHVNSFVSKFCTDASYDIDALHQDLQRQFSIVPMSHDENYSTSRVNDRNDPSDVDVETRRDPVSGSAPRVDDERTRSSKLESASTVFQRKMFVQEYIWYGSAMFEQSRTSVAAMREEFVAAYQRVREIYVSYTNDEDFTEYEFVKKHLAEYKLPGFVELLPSRLLQTPVYETQMKTKLRHMYKELYDEDLDPDGMEYLFQTVKSLQLGVHAGDLYNRVQDFKAETDTIIENIFYVYTTTFARSPDNDELRNLVQEYRAGRNNKNTSEINEAIILRLMNTLEFHDIIKSKLRAAYTVRHSAESSIPVMSAGAMYQLLQVVLKEIPTCSSLADVDAAVEKVIDAWLSKN
jgi:hypothetical protein